jgi:ABC-type bacteriocin/lantibiotic exporter with double-glycine peptidase domain
VASHHPAVGERLATVAYAGRVKEFVVYTALRIGLFVGSLVVVAWVWTLFADAVPVFWVFVIALVLSGLASYFLLRRQREAFARRVERRAERMQERFERARSREDAD